MENNEREKEDDVEFKGKEQTINNFDTQKSNTNEKHTQWDNTGIQN